MAMKSLRRWARRTKRRLNVAAEILRHPHTPWYARLAGILVIGYAASPLDLIPDFIPVLGYLDDLILVPLGILIVVRLTPKEIRRDAMRIVLKGEREGTSRLRHIGTVLIVGVWIAVAYLLARLLFRLV
jgi:uncharacterized membrane protein YkvA (DUF1232 family)